MATLDDVVTVQKNGVIGVNNINKLIVYTLGQVTCHTVTSTTLVVTGAGHIVNFSVVVPGTTNGFIYDANSTSAIATSNCLSATPTTLGIFQCSQKFDDGIVIVPGTGQSINVTYSID